MKTLYIQFIVIMGVVFSSHFAYAQCSAFAGEDIHRCSDQGVILGGNPSAINGTPPYTYAWSIKPIPLFSSTIPFLYASTILNDTTLPNPVLAYNNAGDSLNFFLTITDSLGCQSFDTVILTTSYFGIHLGTSHYDINQGDSVYLNLGPNVFGGYGTSVYDWSPSHGLSDTTLPSGFWAKPDTSTAYSVTVTDSRGCSKTGSPVYYVNILPVGINEVLGSKMNIYPNPSTNSLTIANLGQQKAVTIEIRNVTGQVVYAQKEAHFSKTRVNTSNIPVGVYLVNIKAGQQNLATQKWVKVE